MLNSIHCAIRKDNVAIISSYSYEKVHEDFCKFLSRIFFFAHHLGERAEENKEKDDILSMYH